MEAVVALAHEHGVCLVPFGGGTNIVGGINPEEAVRMVVTLDMTRMNRLLSLDPESNTAVIEAGALGPKLEQDLQARGFSLGHYPDSFGTRRWAAGSPRAPPACSRMPTARSNTCSSP